MKPSPGQTSTFVSVDQFIKGLIDSGLLPAEEARPLAARVPPTQKDDCRPLAKELVEAKKLTWYQAMMLTQGRTKGLVLDNYIILDRIGQGGMGIVYRARHRILEREVALKVLPASVTKDTTAVKRFHREVQAASKLHHANIVTAFDAGHDKMVHFLVMEYVDGSDLSRLVKDCGPLPVGVAVACVLQAARGLAHAHTIGIVHRDIKPSNLLLDKTGVVKILDMGLARFSDNASSPSSNVEITLPGFVFGTCDFMAPEQAMNSARTDARSDIYSLGCTLHYLLTGKPMYPGDTAMEKLVAHREDPIPSLRKARPDVSKALDGIFQRMVAKTAERRYGSAEEVIGDLLNRLDPSERSGTLTGLTTSGKGPPSVYDSTVIQDLVDTRANGEHVRRNFRLRKPLLIGFGVAVGVFVLGWLLFFALRGGSESAVTPTTNAPEKPANDAAKARPTAKSGVDDEWLKSVSSMGPRRQANAVREKLRELNPGWSGKVEPRFENGRMTGVQVDMDQLKDASPLRGLSSLKTINGQPSADFLKQHAP
jgi:serine/threonine protein kinase